MRDPDSKFPCSNMILTLSLMILTGPRNPGGPMSPFHPYGKKQLQLWVHLPKVFTHLVDLTSKMHR